MSSIKNTLLFFIPILFAFFVAHITFLTPFIPQIIALTSLIVIFRFSIPLLIFIINLIVLSTGAIASPLFFLIYFLLFTLSFQNSPLTNLSFSLITIIFFSYSLNSLSTIIELSSLLLITPLTWFISLNHQLQEKTAANLSQDETDFLFWISLQLKKSLKEIIYLSDNPKITKIAKNLIKNSEKLSHSIDQNSDET